MQMLVLMIQLLDLRAMAPKFKKPKTPVTSNKTVQQDIRILAENIRSQVSRKKSKDCASNQEVSNLPPRKRIRFEPTIEETLAAEEDLQNKEIVPVENHYAREIFWSKTNVRDVARRAVIRIYGSDLSEEKLNSKTNHHWKKLYRNFVNDPKYRIREPLNELRFESSYYEYRFFLALNKPLRSEEEYQHYRSLLATAGVEECFVTMRKANLLLKYEDSIIRKVQRQNRNWSGKLDKLHQYLLDAHELHERKRKPQHSDSGIDPLLAAILYESNAKIRHSESTIRQIFPVLRIRLEEKCDRIKWLVFNNDNLNREYALGKYQKPPSLNVSEQVSSEDNSPGNSSQNSEIVQMRSEMATTQPTEIVLPGTHGTMFFNTEELINALQPTQKSQPDQIPAAVEVPTLDIPILPEDEPPEQHVNRMTAQPSPEHSVEPLTEPLTKSSVEPNDVPSEVLTANPSAELPIEREASVVENIIVLSDSDESPAEGSSSKAYTLEFLRKFTNIEERVAQEMRKKFPDQSQNTVAKLDKYLNKYFSFEKATFSQGKLPCGIVFLNKSQIREKKNVERNQITKSAISTNSSESLCSVSEPRKSKVVHIATPIPRPKTPVPKTIQYDEDSPQPLTNARPDTMPMPDSENFAPEYSSTQNEPMYVRQATPFVSPVRSSPTTSREASRRSFQESTVNITVLQTNYSPKPKNSVTIKREPLNCSNYEGEVEFVPLSNSAILVDDSLSAGCSQVDVNELIERRIAANSEDSAIVGVPSVLRGMVNQLFIVQQQNITLSQSSSGSGSSGSGTQSSSIGITPGQKNGDNVEVRQESLVGFQKANPPKRNLFK
ncbi:uncharacterized protein LOC129748734 [Uranotaenia lowii]|uniref:uncharacterized protein LOC129748734 n=1 Tax=Uranotaenia lowii TaxID=190385 RepID=UPI00247B1E3F|nr:uncharacterized protein LOC129748734 [Uranotaenia lowii]